MVAGSDVIQLDSRIYQGITGPEAFAPGSAALDAHTRIIYDSTPAR